MHAGHLPWAELPFVLAIARTGTFSGAADLLAVDRTTVARRLEQIETQQGLQLFDRSDTGLTPTQRGREVVSMAELAEQELAGLSSQAQVPLHSAGRVRVSMSEHMLQVLRDPLAELIAAHSDIFLEFLVGDRFVDLSRFEADVAIRLSRGEDPKLFSHPVGLPRFALFRSAGPMPDDIGFIGRIVDAAVPDNILREFPEMPLRARADGITAALGLVRSGVGCAMLPCYLVARDPGLVQMMPLSTVHMPALRVLCRSEHRRLRRVKLVTDALISALADLPGLDR